MANKPHRPPELKLSNDSAIELGKVPDVPRFLRVIGSAFPGAFLHLEGSSIDSKILECVGPSLIAEPVHAKRGTWWPRSERLVAVIDESLMNCLSDAAEHLATPEVADHLLVSTQSEVLLEVYDLHDAQARMSSVLPPAVREQLLSVTVRPAR